MSIAIEHVAQPIETIVEHRPWYQRRSILSAVVIAVMLILYFALRTEYPWPTSLQWNSLGDHLDSFQSWLIGQRNADHPNLAFRIFNGFATFLDDIVGWLNQLFHWLTWVGTTAAAVVVVLRYGGVKAAAWVAGAFFSFAFFGLWDESIQTVSLMLAAVMLSLLVGIPLGVLAGRSRRFERAITPILDAMQIIPAFAYLMPVVILFSVGPGAAVITTMIYAVPPAIRITALGIRKVPKNTVEAAEAMGSTRLQLLAKVQLPLARRLILLGVNQTILFALSMVVIAGLIGGKGLGDTVTSGLNSYPALALLAGIVIVIVAVAFDRATEAIAARTDPTRKHLTAELRQRLWIASGVALLAIVVAAVLGKVFDAGPIYTDWSKRDWVLARIQSVLDYIQNPGTFVFHITEPFGNFVVQHLLVPLRDLFVDTPWFITLAGLTALALIVSGRRAAITAFAMLSLIGLIGEWATAMETLSQVAVATAMAVVLGLGLGVWAAESKTVSRILRPVNDVLQTLPQLVYIIPLIYLLPVSIVPGMIAGVLYSFPVVARLVENGIRGVEANTIEAADSFGATRAQVLLKVKIPLAQDAIMLGVNQGIIMVLAVVVIGGLVGSGGLGYQVAQGLDRSEFGLGVVASLAILALGIALDRVTQGARPRKRGLA
jgi:glycine betaine/proline transport system permease protein